MAQEKINGVWVDWYVDTRDFKCGVLEPPKIEAAMFALSLNKKQPVGRMEAVAKKLAPLDGGHNKFLSFMSLVIVIRARRKWWHEMATYTTGVRTSSESTMHTLMRDGRLTEDDFTSNTDPASIEIVNKHIENGNEVKAFDSLPEGFFQTRAVSLNMQMIRHIFLQRQHHRLPEWQLFCNEFICKKLEYREFLGLEEVIPPVL